MLASLLVTKQIIGNVVEMAMPTVKAWMADVRNERDLKAKATATSSSSLNGGKPGGRVERVAKAVFHRAYGWWEGSKSSEKAKAKEAKVRQQPAGEEGGGRCGADVGGWVMVVQVEAAKQAAAAYAIENPQLEEVRTGGRQREAISWREGGREGGSAVASPVRLDGGQGG